MRILLNTLLGVILLIFSIIASLLISTKFFNKNNACLNSFFDLYEKIENLEDNSYVSYSFVSNENCLIGYYPKEALIFDKNFFDNLKKSEDSDYVKFIKSNLKYPFSYNCKNLKELENCGDFENFYSLSHDYSYLDKIIYNFFKANEHFYFAVASISSIYLLKLWKSNIIELSKIIIKEKLKGKIAEEIREKIKKEITKKLIFFSAKLVIFFNPFNFLLSVVNIGLFTYGVYDLYNFYKDIKNTLKDIEDYFNNFLLFWNYKFLEQVKKSFLSFPIEGNIKGKEGSLIYCDLEDNKCKFDGEYFKKLDIDYLSGSIGLKYPLFFDNALLLFKKTKNNQINKKYFIFKLKLAGDKKLVVLIEENDPILNKAKIFFDLIKNKEVVKLSDLSYLDVIIKNENNKAKVYLLFYGLVEFNTNNKKLSSKFFNNNPLVIDPNIYLENLINKKFVLNNISQNFKENNNTIITIEKGILKIHNEKRLNLLFKELENELKKCSNYEINDNFSKFFFNSSCYTFILYSYLLNKLDNKKFNTFVDFFEYLKEDIEKKDRKNILNYLNNCILNFVVYEKENFDEICNIQNNKEIKEKLNKKLNNYFFCYDLKKEKLDFDESTFNILNFLIYKTNTRP